MIEIITMSQFRKARFKIKQYRQYKHTIQQTKASTYPSKYANPYMIESRLYYPCQLASIEDEHKLKNHPELYLKRQVIVQERQFIRQLIYMIQGLQTQLFVKVYNEMDVNLIREGDHKTFHFSMRQESRVMFAHLSNPTLKACAATPLKIANYLQYLTSKSRTIYQQSSNLFIKSFAEGIMHYLSRVTVELTKLLTQLQIQSGRLSNTNAINTECYGNAFNHHHQLNNNESQSFTLLKVSHLFESKTLFIEELVNVFSKTLPYVALDQSQGSTTDKYLAIQLLLDEFSRLINTIELTQKEKQQLLNIYENSLTLYVQMIRNWLLMNPYLLQSMKTIPFFIKLSQVNLSLSKCSLSHQKYVKLRKPTFQSIELKQQVYKSEQFSELFFKLQNLLVEEYMPEMFKKQGLCVLELGKIVQFIYLYFAIEQKPFIVKYFDVEKEFQPLFQLIQQKKFSQPPSSSSSLSSMFINNTHPRRQRKQISISQRMATTQRKPLRHIEQHHSDNPYEMFPLTRGIFIDTETTLASSTCREIIQQSQQPVTRGVESSAQVQSIIVDEENRQKKVTTMRTTGYSVVETFGLKFQRILSQIIQKLYQKALYFFQQQSQRQFFKLQSHIKLPSQSLVSPSHQHQQPLLQKKCSILIQQTPLNLSLITDHQRIIQSISLTLIGIKKFMLYQQGDFFMQLISIATMLFESSAIKISRSLVTSYIEQAIKSSSANDLTDNIKGKISFLFLKKTKDPEIKQLKVWSVFSILYRPQFPVNCIFNNEIMTSFGEIFNFIFNIKQCEHTLKTIWADFKQNAKITTQYSLFQTKKHPFQSKILAVRNNIHHFVNLIFGSVMITIEELWKQYTQEISLSFMSNMHGDNSQNTRKNRKIHNPISLIKLTQDLLRSLKKQITENLTLANTMILITQLIGKFKKLLKMQQDSKDWNDVIFAQQIGYIGHQFMGIMEMAKNIDGVGESIFYNVEF